MTKEHGFQECVLGQGETQVEMKMDLLQVVNLTKENPAPHHPHRNLIEDCQICSKSSMNHTPQEGNKLSD
ncbi:hypothetical protein RHMOL_Rhmol10G0247300 [Rhododendron molle]|uniref:Uncharacterized protein n=1 Tax=Rhododendron molle TaxID=49168 RepID=A0ACC0M722_RHOML|nr:hypothetical protein RHMOL_Rhmol10G0247300 [Rhododendron molle]